MPVTEASLPEYHFLLFGEKPPDEARPFPTIYEFTEKAAAGEACEFCDVPENNPDTPIDLFDMALPIDEAVALKPALGMLVEGYFLAITQRHVTSFAQLEKAELSRVDERLKVVEQKWVNIFKGASGGETIGRLEHGSDGLDGCSLGAGACVSHGHQHIFPGHEAIERMEAAGDWEELENYDDLVDLRGRPYLYLGYEDRHLVQVDPQVPSQWGRRIIAATYGEELWDWAVTDGASQFAATLIRLEFLPPCRMILDVARDRITVEPETAPGVAARLIVRGNWNNRIESLIGRWQEELQ